jgi:hypothetical protein
MKEQFFSPVWSEEPTDFSSRFDCGSTILPNIYVFYLPESEQLKSRKLKFVASADLI